MMNAPTNTPVIRLHSRRLWWCTASCVRQTPPLLKRYGFRMAASATVQQQNVVAINTRFGWWRGGGQCHITIETHVQGQHKTLPHTVAQGPRGARGSQLQHVQEPVYGNNKGRVRTLESLAQYLVVLCCLDIVAASATASSIIHHTIHDVLWFRAYG